MTLSADKKKYFTPDSVTPAFVTACASVLRHACEVRFDGDASDPSQVEVVTDFAAAALEVLTIWD